MVPYHFSVTIHKEFSEVVDRTRAALVDHGFGIVSEIDMAARITEKLGVDQDPYLILGACNPGFSRAAVVSEPSAGVLLPSQVVVRSQNGDGVVVDFLDPAVIVDLVGEDQIHDIADEVRTRLEMVRDALATS